MGELSMAAIASEEEVDAAGDVTKQENTTVSSDDLSSLSVLPVDEKLSQALADTTKESDAEVTDNLEETVIRVDPDDDQPPVGEEPLKEGAVVTAGGTLIIKDYVDQQQEPDKLATPPQDPTGHIKGVQGHTQGQIINSEKKEVDPELKKKLFGSLLDLDLIAADIPVLNTAQKAAKESPVD